MKISRFSECKKPFTRFFSTNLLKIKREAVAIMEKEYNPQKIHLDGFMAYSLRDESPEQMIEQGGILAHIPKVDISKVGGVNTGSVCMSALFDICSIFLSTYDFKKDQGNLFLYAFRLQGEFYNMQDEFLQIISPGALITPDEWYARKIIDYDSDKVQLGPVIKSNGLDIENEKDTIFQEYLTTGLLKIPQNQSEQDPCDYDPHYPYQDSDIFQDQREKLSAARI